MIADPITTVETIVEVPDVDIFDIRSAQMLRTQAERTTDPNLYEQAAIAFETLGMLASAARCRERAKHYTGGF